MRKQWQEINKSEIELWNAKLKTTCASFFQYPYYASGYKEFFLSKPIYLKLADEQNNEKAFCTILQIGFFPFKIALVIRGPVLLDEKFSIKDIIFLLKKYTRKKGYIFLRINPDDNLTENILKDDSEFIKKNFFPIYNGSQSKDFNIYKIEEDKLLKSFRADCRSKIRFAEELDFKFSAVESEIELKSVYKIFKILGATKGFSYRPFKSYKNIFNHGYSTGLCTVYLAKLNGEIISVVFIVKDSKSYNSLSAALVLSQNLRAKHSPSNKLHYLAIKDCFYKENKKQYNLSYSTPDSSVYMFKDSFHPQVEQKPEYYTYLINKRLSLFLFSLQQKDIKKIKLFLRQLINVFKR